MPTLAPEADMNRPIIIMAGDEPTGHREFQMMYQMLPAIHTGRRPYVSDSAATRNGAKPRPRKKTEKAIWPVVVLIFKSCRIWSNAGAIMLADIVVTSWLAEHTIPTVIFL